MPFTKNVEARYDNGIDIILILLYTLNFLRNVSISIIEAPKIIKANLAYIPSTNLGRATVPPLLKTPLGSYKILSVFSPLFV